MGTVTLLDVEAYMVERSKHQGIPRTLLDTSRDFFAWEFVWFLFTALFSLPAMVAVLILDFKSVGYLLIGMVVLSITFTGSLFEESPEQEGEYVPDLSELTQNELLLYFGILYAVLSASVSTVLLFSSLIAGLAGYTSGYPLVAIVIAAIFPLVDIEIADYVPSFSFGRRGADAVVFLINSIARLYGIHTNRVRETTEKGKSIY